MVAQQQGKLGFPIARLAVGILSPLIVYFVIRPHATSDTEALALAWFVPIAWTLGFSLWRRRIEVYALLGVVAYSVALAIATFFGVGALALKLHHAVVAGAIGLVCLVSVAMGKPIFLVIVRRNAKNTNRAEQIAIALENPKIVKLITHLTLIVGVVCMADAVVQTVFALALSTSAFLIATTVIHVAPVVVILLGVGILLWVRANR
jgi:hypothetical protein